MVPVPSTRGDPGSFALGPEDPRVIAVPDGAGHHRLVTVFNLPAMEPDGTLVRSATGDPGRHMYIMPQALPGTIDSAVVKLVLRSGAVVTGAGDSDLLIPLHQFEKNWSPLYIHERLHFIRNFAPLQVVRCELDGACVHVHGCLPRRGATATDTNPLAVCEDDDKDNGKGTLEAEAEGDWTVGSLRGGTPFAEWRFPYFVGLAHSTTGFHGRHLYRMHMVVIRVDPTFEVVFVSDALRLPTAAPGAPGPLKQDWMHLVEVC